MIREEGLWCQHCDDYTEQETSWSDHERDSSSDYQRCLRCGWERIGGGRWRPPQPPKEPTFRLPSDPPSDGLFLLFALLWVAGVLGSLAAACWAWSRC